MDRPGSSFFQVEVDDPFARLMEVDVGFMVNIKFIVGLGLGLGRKISEQFISDRS